MSDYLPQMRDPPAQSQMRDYLSQTRDYLPHMSDYLPHMRDSI